MIWRIARDGLLEPDLDRVAVGVGGECEREPGGELAARGDLAAGGLHGVDRLLDVGGGLETEAEVGDASGAARPLGVALERDDVLARALRLDGGLVAVVLAHAEHGLVELERA